MGAKTGAVTAVQRTSSDMRLNPHLHTIALDGTWHEQGNELAFAGLGHLKTSEVGDVLERAVRRIERHLNRCGLLGTKDEREACPWGTANCWGGSHRSSWIARSLASGHGAGVLCPSSGPAGRHGCEDRRGHRGAEDVL